MSIKDTIDQTPIPLSRPLVFNGSEIVDSAIKKLHVIMNKVTKDEEPLSVEEERLKNWLGRLEVVIRRDNKYSLSIEEAVDCGLIS